MRKADSLRAWLTACLPAEFKADPDRLQIYLESGSISARQSHTLSFVYGYTVKALVTDFTGNPDTLIVPILAWIEKEQPQLLRRQDSQPFTFEAEILDTEKSDIEISIDLTENVVVKLRGDGKGYDLEHPPEPDFTDAFAGVSATFTDAFAGDGPLLLSEGS
ncbi:P2 phage tail completion R family protein [Novosphingobium sp. Rr 2-17]|uniref:phage tail protein n=1 Tax=Novosphingobium sp. Rr 2-17 TaxID=555793 RepID=UPI0002698598|nr:phage tail protein [Novosphingobium sp. Rr 2-17]EIZ77764.1 P2 phage tail completion R family protein [Novosphingobium sp. Rr 2-17]